MTTQITGKIEKIVSKQIPPDKYENTFRTSIKIGDKWIGVGTSKKAGVSIQKGKDWIAVEEGDEVAVFADQNGDFLNAKKSDIKLLKKGAAQAAAVPDSPLPSGAKTNHKQTGMFESRDTEIKAGMFFNKAVDVAIAKHGEKVSKEAVVQAYGMLEQAYAECRSAKKAPEPRDVAPDEEESTNFDDDLPF